MTQEVEQKMSTQDYLDEQTKKTVSLYNLHFTRPLSEVYKNLGMFALYYSSEFDENDATNEILMSITSSSARCLFNKNSNLYIDIFAYNTIRQCLLHAQQENNNPRLGTNAEMLAVIEEVIEEYSNYVSRRVPSFLFTKLAETNEITMFNC